MIDLYTCFIIGMIICVAAAVKFPPLFKLKQMEEIKMKTFDLFIFMVGSIIIAPAVIMMLSGNLFAMFVGTLYAAILYATGNNTFASFWREYWKVSTNLTKILEGK